MAAAPRKRSAPRNATEVDEEPARPVGPVRIGGRAPTMIDIFELDGVMYQAAKDPSAVLVHDYLQALRKAYQVKNASRRNAVVAEATESYIKTILGEEAWQALRDSPEVTAEDVAAVVELVSKEIGLPAVEKITGALGNS